VLTLYAVSWFSKHLVRIENVQWDLQTRTAADYTLEIPVSTRQCHEITKQELTEEEKQEYGEHISPAMHMKLILSRQIEQTLEGLAKKEGITGEMKVADINFTYKNAWLYDLLTKRGDAIKWYNWSELAKINLTLTKQIHVRREQVMNPIGAFITLRNEESYNLMAS